MAYAAAGLLLALGVALLAWRRSRRPGGFYDAGVYGMDARAHRRYCAVSLGFALLFAIAWAWRLETAGIVALALYAVIAVLYAASFLRGAADADE